jgi:hypothetical protein
VKGVPGTKISEVFKPEGDLSVGSLLTYKIEGLKQGTSYKITIVATSEGGMATKAVAVTAKTVKVAGATKLAVERGTKATISSVKLQWKAAPTVTGYMIEIWEPAKAKGAEPKLIRVIEPPEITGTKYEVTGLMAQTKYTFRVVGITADGVATTVVSKVISTAKYPAVTHIQLVAPRTDASITLTWGLPKYNSTFTAAIDPVTHYEVYLVNKDKTETSLGFTEGTDRNIMVTLPSTGKYTVYIRAIEMVDGVILNKSLGAKIAVKAV